LTGDQHTDHISNGQRVSRHSLPTLLYFLFSPPHIFINSILASRTLAHLQAAQADPQTQACKRANFANAPMTIIGLKNVIWATKYLTNRQ